MPKQINQIIIDFIPQSEQRYDTVGDFFFEGEILRVKISTMKNPLWEHAILLHELIEALLCNHADVAIEAIDAFDMGPGKDLPEPGFDPAAPYHVQHCWADVVERTFIAAAGENWSQYDAAVGDHGIEE